MRIVPVLALALAAMASAAESQDIAVVYSDGRPPVALASVVRDGVIYHRINEIAAGLSGLVSWVPARRRAAIIAGPDSIALTIDSRFLVVNGRALCLDHPIVFDEGAILVPESFVRAVPSLLTSVRATWVDSLGQLTIEGVPCDVTLLRVVEDETSVRFEISIPSYATWELSPVRHDSVSLLLNGVTVCPSEFDGLLSDSSLASVAAHQEPGRAVIVMQRAYPWVEARCTASGGSLILELGESMDIPRSDRPIGRIVIDAGHGGSDAGARSPDGATEKDVTLALAKLLTESLQDRGHDLDVFLCRDGDVDIPATVRVQRANAAGAEAFVSIHCNWSFDRSLSGPQVVFLLPALSGGAGSVRAREGVVLAGDMAPHAPWPESGPGMQRMSAWGTVHNRWIAESEALAHALTDAMAAVGLGPSPPQQRALDTLTGLAMPAILVEVGYLSNPIEARHLLTLEHLHTLAGAMAEGIIAFVDDSRQVSQP
ncbi:N-acetylmuramoyl-L-alanine amidase [Candidatus Fermentibacteria bacterium]|nr:N-acetylmuramoyl-L-alanine amidase [Candidatus Fermentibacteria bacterium]